MKEETITGMAENANDGFRTWITPGLVAVGIVAVIIIFRMALGVMPERVDASSIKDIAGMTGTAIAMIGTLISFAAGHYAGSAGREKAERRALVETMEKEHEMTRANVLWTMLPQQMKDEARDQRPDLFSSEN
jgi:hypothetical protein